MSIEHFHDAGGYIDHGDASTLFPVESLPGEIYQHREAQLRLETVVSDAILVISPTGLASSYFLTQHPLTVVEIDSLPKTVRSAIANQADVDISQFEVVQIGRRPSQPENRSLAEF